jgi:hypothetical protein
MDTTSIPFYNANYCIKCQSQSFSKEYYEEETTIENGLLLPRSEGFICQCNTCAFKWLAPLGKQAYYCFDDAEQLDCIRTYLDKEKVPTTDTEGNIYSYIGRIKRYGQLYRLAMYESLSDEQ